MTPKHLLAAVLSVAVFISCSNNGNEGSEPETSSKKVPVTVTVEFPDLVNSRAVTFPNSSGLATEKESRLNNIAVFVFNNQKLLEAFDSDDQIRYGGFQGSTATFEFTVSVGRMYVFAVANVPKSYLSYATEGISMDEFSEEILKYDLEVLTGKDFLDVDQTNIDALLAYESRGFFMTSKLGSSGTMAEFWAQDTDDITVNTFELELERAVAKVAVAFDPESQPEGELTEVQYIVTNNPASFYVVQHYSGSALITPNYYENDIDDNNYQDPLDDYQPAILPGMADNNKTWTYCMENSNFLPKEGSATMAMIKGKFTPATWLKADGSSGGAATSDGTFWRVATVRADGTKALDPGYYEATPVGVPVTPGSADETKEILQYPNGICYYPVWLRNPNSGNENKYTVKRNSYYKLTIDSVSGSGWNDPDESIDPPTPLDRQVDIVVSVSVSNWSTIEDSQGL
ncbi:MAG: Mfa1 family fimbria major subunit [Rikenellaceae bacterium]|nr:Mfa1 family fimbria major subunit [Rikenellaceae bacterium]